MRYYLHTLIQKPWAIPAVMGLLLILGLALGIGVGHWVKRSHTPPPPPAVAAAAPAPQPEQPAAAPVPVDEPAPLPPIPNMPVPSMPVPNMEDDQNGPAVVVPMPAPVPPPPAQVAAPPPEAVLAPAVTAKPSRSGNAQPAWLRFAVPSQPVAGRPMIVVVIDDLGLDKRRTHRTLDLPAPLTLSFMTYAEDLPAVTASAHQRGHELLVHMPMQAMSAHFSAGPNALEVGLPPDEIRRRMEWGLDRFTGYVGVNNHMGSRFTADGAGMQVVMQEIKKRGLLFLDSVTTDVSAAPDAAHKAGIPFAQRQVFLDNEQSQEAIRDQLAKTEAIARKHGQAIAIGHPHDATLAALAAWLPGLQAKGFDLVPLTTLVKEQRK